MGLVLFIAATSCNHDKKFDREKWGYGDGLTFPQRDDIINDLLKNHKIKGLTYRQVYDSLGRPQGRDTLQLSYQITDNSSKYGRKDPVHRKTLILYFSKDSIVTKAEIHEFTEKKKK